MSARAPRLSPTSLESLPARVQRPAYRPESHGVGIAHLGIGAFHRAHQAVYVDRVLDRSGGDWRICGISCRSSAVQEQLVPQQGLYSVIERSPAGPVARVVGSVARVVVAAQDPAESIDAMAAESVRLITLTVTEKGYGRHAVTGQLDLAHPDIAHDLATPDRPRTPIGLLVAALRRRAEARGTAPTVLCCDNLPENGRTVRRLVREFAARVDPSAAAWVSAHVRFPCSVVDRIVPATRPADVSAAEVLLGMRDEGVVFTEPYSQWVVEDDFSAERPPLELAGVQFVRDVRPFELAKLRLLNGAHSSLAYLGQLVGLEFVHQAVADQDLAVFLRQLMARELAPTLSESADLKPQDYQRLLLERFANPALEHRLAQIAMDGTQKLPQRLLTPLAERLACGAPVDALTLAVAGWMRFVMARDELGVAWTIEDPLASAIAAALQRTGQDAANIVDALLHLDGTPFSPQLSANPVLRTHLVRDLNDILTLGVRSTLQRRRALLAWL